MSKQLFPSSGQADLVRPQNNLCLKDYFVILKNEVLVEVSFLVTGVNVLSLPVSSSVSLHYWGDRGKHYLPVLLNLLEFFPELWNLLSFLLQHFWCPCGRAGMSNNPKRLLILSVFWLHCYPFKFSTSLLCIGVQNYFPSNM